MLRYDLDFENLTDNQSDPICLKIRPESDHF